MIGNVPCTITLNAGTDDYPYQEVVDFNLELTLSQSGFPLGGLVVKSSPIIADLDNNGSKEDLYSKVDDLIVSNKITHTPTQTSDPLQSLTVSTDSL